MPLQRLPARGLLLLLLTLVLLPAAPLAAQDSSWEGSAAVIRKGEFESPGLFAASDSFPQGTLLLVENPQNGKTAQVTVVERIDGRGSVFLLLSEQAAAVLGLQPSEVLQVKARVLIASIDAARPGAPEQAASQDPDLNPAASLPPAAPRPEPAAAAAPAQQAPVEPAPAPESPPEAAPLVAEAPPAPAEPGLQPAAAATPAQQAASLPAPAAELPAEAETATPVAEIPAETPVEAPAPATAVPESRPEAGASPQERRLEELAARLPQKRLFQPPAGAAGETAPEAPAVAATPQEAPAAVEQAPAVAEPAVEAPAPEGGSLSALPPEQPVETAELPEGEAPEEPPVAESAPTPEQPLAAPEPAVAAPEVAVEVPPEAPPAAEPGPEPAIAAPEVAIEVPPAAPAVATLPATTREEASPLVRKSFYLQLGAYATRGLAEKLASEVASYARYTVEILPFTSGARPLFKVLIGPLNRDESGTLLYQFRARGFRDAFLQYIE